MSTKSMSTIQFPDSADVYEIVDKKAREEKIDKYQGIENVGKSVTIGSDGQITLSDTPTELSNEEIDKIIEDIGGLE